MKSRGSRVVAVQPKRGASAVAPATKIVKKEVILVTDYTPKSIGLTGNTYPIKDSLKDSGFFSKPNGGYINNTEKLGAVWHTLNANENAVLDLLEELDVTVVFKTLNEALLEKQGPVAPAVAPMRIAAAARVGIVAPPPPAIRAIRTDISPGEILAIQFQRMSDADQDEFLALIRARFL
jgi:hypothetical protein